MRSHRESDDILREPFDGGEPRTRGGARARRLRTPVSSDDVILARRRSTLLAALHRKHAESTLFDPATLTDVCAREAVTRALGRHRRRRHPVSKVTG